MRLMERRKRVGAHSRKGICCGCLIVCICLFVFGVSSLRAPGLAADPESVDIPAVPPAKEAQASPPQATPAVQSPKDTDIEKLVLSALEKHTKDREIVEVGMAMKAADLLVGWVKLLGVVVAIPLAVAVFVLGWFGISKFEDIRKLLEKANETLADARAKAEAANRDAQETQTVLAAAQRSKAEIDEQMQKLQADIQANDQRIRTLDATVKDIALRFAADVPVALQEKMRPLVTGFREYFEMLGYKAKAEAPQVSTKIQEGAIAYYDPGSNSILVHPAYAESEYAVLRQYAHHLLISARPAGQFSAESQEWIALQYGLADYFPASFQNRSRLEAIAAGSAAPAYGDFVIDLDNNTPLQLGRLSYNQMDGNKVRERQRAWGGVLWEIRQKLGKQVADKCIYEAWCALPPDERKFVKRSIGKSFIAMLATQASAVGPEGEQIVRDALSRRGVKSADLPGKPLAAVAQ